MINVNDDNTPNSCNEINTKGRNLAIMLKFLTPAPNSHNNNNNDDATNLQ